MMSPGAVALQARGLTRAFGQTLVLRGLTFSVPAGQRVAVLGPNGAGKTTLLKVIATLLRPTAGQVSVGGYDVVQDATAVRRLIGYAGHQTLLYDGLTARENLEFYARLYRVPDAARRVAAMLDAVGLTDRARIPAGQLSHGQRQRCALARALLHAPAVLVLDEPDTGLDATAQTVLDDLVRSGERTVLFTTHSAERAARLADRLLALEGGRVAADSAPQAAMR
jgi:heme exporter protein A